MIFLWKDTIPELDWKKLKKGYIKFKYMNNFSKETQNDEANCLVDLSKAKFQFFDLVKEVGGRKKRTYWICDTVVCGRNSDMIGYTLLYKKGKYVYKTVYAIEENALILFNKVSK